MVRGFILKAHSCSSSRVMTRIFLRPLIIVALCAFPFMSASEDEFVDFKDCDDDEVESFSRPAHECVFLSPPAATSVAEFFQLIAQKEKSGGVGEFNINPPPLDSRLSPSRCAFSDNATFVNLSVDRLYTSGLDTWTDLLDLLGSSR